MSPHRFISGLRFQVSGLLLALCLLPPAPSRAAARESRGTFGATVTSVAFIDAMVAAGIPAHRLPALGATHYVKVRRPELVGLVALARYRLSKDVPQYDVRYNCFAFAWNLVNEATKELCREDWHAPAPRAKRDSIVSIRPAIVPVTYTQERTGLGHTINLVLTDAGLLFVDPQTGVVALTPAELATLCYPAA